MRKNPSRRFPAFQERTVLNVPKVKWMNSKTYSEQKPDYPVVISDSMPDGIHSYPNDLALANMTRHMEANAVRNWLDEQSYVSSPVAETKVAEEDIIPTPSFENGTIVTEASLVVDAHGVHWWVDPSIRCVRRI